MAQNLPAQVDRGLLQEGEHSRYTLEDRQRLRALIGDDNVSDGDLDMLVTVAKSTGLNPFTKEVYLVGRKTKTGGYRGEPERWETKWTVQTGIDGFRKATHRYAEQKGAPVVFEDPVFYTASGEQRPFWTKAMGEHPEACSITIRVGDSSATGFATWDEYAQVKNGTPTAMWAKMPSVMLAKCAEAQAHRRICPLTSHLYESAEMDQAENPVQVTATRADKPSTAAATQQANDLLNRLGGQKQVEAKPDDNELVAQILESLYQADTQDAVKVIMESLPEDLHEDGIADIRAVATTRWEELAGGEQ